MRTLQLKTKVFFPLDQVMKRHSDPNAICRWIVANDRVDMQQVHPAQNGQHLVLFRLRLWFWPVTSYLRVHFDPANLFRIKQEKGILRRFEYCASFRATADGTEIIDEMQYSLRCRWFFYRYRLKYLEKILHEVIADKNRILQEELTLLERYPTDTPLKILILGAHGFIGRPLDQMLTSFGHQVFRAVREKQQLSEPNTILFNEVKGEVNRDAFEGFDAFINLAGANIAKKRWTKEWRDEIYRSRVLHMQRLSKLLLSLEHPPKTVISSSAVGFYGPHVEHATESTPMGKGFLARLAADWEQATQLATNSGSRVVIYRFGAVLGRAGGMLRIIRSLGNFSLLGAIANGRQKLPWIAHRDVLGAIYHALMRPETKGIYNLVADDHPSQQKLAKLVADSLHRNVLPFSLPVWLVKLMVGAKMAKELVLSSQIVENQKIKEEGYTLFYPEIEALINRTPDLIRSRP